MEFMRENKFTAFLEEEKFAVYIHFMNYLPVSIVQKNWEKKKRIKETIK